MLFSFANLLGGFFMTKLHDIVKDLLEKNPTLRDSDRKLIWQVWVIDGSVKDGYLDSNSFMDATHPESVRRVRQKIQENHPHLQSSKAIQLAKKEKQSQKGTFIYREKIKPTWDFVEGIAVMRTKSATD